MGKILQKILQNKKNVSIREFETLLKHFGFYKKRQKGSHGIYYNQEKKQQFNFPHNRPVKQFLNIIKNEI
jgi:predicted RNA binding protein YcfA (HicA-like mRNA interferase family)